MSKLADFIRVSVGTAAALGLLECKMDALLTTAYIMTYSPGRCMANCGFCSQAFSSHTTTDRLSRITWPVFPIPLFMDALSEKRQQLSLQRLCIQTLLSPGLETDLIHLANTVRQAVPHIPVSVAVPPLSPSGFIRLKESGVERVAISLDAVTAALFHAVKGPGVNGPFRWKTHLAALESALTIFGPGQTTTHLIIGLGETEEEAVICIQQLVNRGITIGLFPFTPIPGTRLSRRCRPSLVSYRRLQLAHYLITRNLVCVEQMTFDSEEGRLTSFGLSENRLEDVITVGQAFRTAGCPGCNRPFFTEQPGGPLYNHPVLPPAETLQEIRNSLGGVL